MADISKINLSGAVYNIKDAIARANLNEIQNISNAEIDEITDLVLESLPSSYVYGYETAAAMQADLDLQEGMIAHTNGFTTSGDGDAAYYTISNSGTADGSTILALQNGLRAIKVSEKNLIDAIPNMSATTRGIAKVGAGLAMNGDALELDGNGDIATAVISWLNAHPEATTTVEDGAVTTDKLANGAVTDDKLAQSGGVLFKVNKLENIAYSSDLKTLTPDATPNGWYLNGTGTCSADSSSMITKYQVTAGDYLYLHLSDDNAGVYQWQNNASVPSTTNPYVVGTPVTSAIDGIVVVPEGATYLIVSQFITNTTNFVQLSYPVNKIITTLKKEYDIPIMRNGSVGNPANPNPIAMSQIQPVNSASAIRVTTNVALNEGQRYYWMVNIFSSSFGISTIPALHVYDPYDVTTDNYIDIVNDGSFNGFAVALYVYNQDGTFTPLRVADTGDCLTCRYFYDYGPTIRTKKLIQTPPLVHGTLTDWSRAGAMKMVFPVSTQNTSSVIFTYSGDLNYGDTLLWQVMTFATQSPVSSGNYIRFIDGDGDKKFIGNKYIFHLRKNEKFIAVAVIRKDKNGNDVTITATNGYAKCISLRFLDENIVNRNEDILPAVYASSKYGINGLGTQNINKGLSMLVSTDIHNCVDQIESAIDYLNAINSIDCGICLGDITGSNYSESDGTWYTNVINQSKKPFYTAIGNHDGGNSVSISVSGTKSQQFAKWIEPTLEILGINDLTTTYYKINFTNYPVTLIVLDNYDVPDTLASNGDFAVSRGVEAISQTQLNWFISALASVPSENHLIIARHSGGCASYNSVTNAVFTQIGRAAGSVSKGYNIDPIIEVVEAWKNGTNITMTCPPVDLYTGLLPELSINADFTSRGIGIFACYLIGHAHWDAILRDTQYNQLCIQFDTAANDNWQTYWSDLPRVSGDKTEDCLTVVSLDTINHKVNLVRVGSNITINMAERTMESLSY